MKISVLGGLEHVCADIIFHFHPITASEGVRVLLGGKKEWGLCSPFTLERKLDLARAFSAHV